MATKLLNLPPIPQSLKSIIPYLQRADELKAKEPIIAYWCAYYAAQIGITLKIQEPAARDVLFGLLTTLEKMKTEIGPSDAIDVEEVSAAYVENFALKVFTMADNEDRKGASDRSTAKKFLAAANFLEVLKTFLKSEVSESNEEKIRYAKWKAGDIARAFREGRKPTPGPANSSVEDELAQLAKQPQAPVPPRAGPSNSNSSLTTLSGGASHSSSSPPHKHPSSPPKHTSSPPKQSHFPPSSHIQQHKRQSPPPHMGSEDITRANASAPLPLTPPRQLKSKYLDVIVPGNGPLPGEGEVTPGSWSTAATPGTAGYNTPFAEAESPTKVTGRRGSGSSSGSSGELSMHLLNGALNGHLFAESHVTPTTATSSAPYSSPTNTTFTGTSETVSSTDSGSSGGSSGSKKSVHFTPSVIGGLSSAGSTPAVSPSEYTPNASHAPWPSDTTPGISIYPADPQPHLNYPQIYAPFAPPPPPVVPPPHINPTKSISIPPPHHVAIPPPPPPEEMKVEPELTPITIAKAQKHCRFAISALDYEDAEQARKELRAALAVLGG